MSDGPPFEWRAIPGRPGYFVSNQGDVGTNIFLMKVPYRNMYRPVEMPNPRMIKPQREKGTGAWLANFGEGKKIRIDGLVLEVFVGPRPKGLKANHINGDIEDDRLSNLEWARPKKTRRPKPFSPPVKPPASKKAPIPKGENHWLAKLTDADAVEIRRLRAQGVKYREIAEAFGVSKVTIYTVVFGRGRFAISPEERNNG